MSHLGVCFSFLFFKAIVMIKDDEKNFSLYFIMIFSY